MLRNAPSPAWPPGYWDAFPKRVLARLLELEPESRILPGSCHVLWCARSLAVCAVIAVVCVLTAVWVLVSGRCPTVKLAPAHAREYLTELRELFPGQLCAVVFDRAGPRLVLAETRDVLDAQPVLIRARSGRQCQAYITFSGQKIVLDGHEYEVLSSGSGGVMLVGEKHVFVVKKGGLRINNHQIEAWEIQHDT